MTVDLTDTSQPQNDEIGSAWMRLPSSMMSGPV